MRRWWQLATRNWRTRPGRAVASVLSVALGVGTVVAIEPMLNVGTGDVEELADGWTVVTADRSLSAHAEHTVAVTERGAEILTAPG